MPRYANTPSFSLTKVFKLIGKPTYFLFTIIVVVIATYLHLLKLFVQQLARFFKSIHLPRFPKLKFPAIPPPRLPRYSIPAYAGRFLFLVLLSCSAGVLFYYYILRDLPSASLLADSPPSLTTKIYDRHGTLLYQIYDNENRSLVNLAQIPPHMVNAALAAEDKNFYQHHGVDLGGIIRAFYKNTLNCKFFTQICSQAGGSTITQQLVKNTLLTPEKTYTRKLKELVLSLWVERLYSKDQILEMYFNQIGYGGTSYGIAQAAEEYFGKDVGELNLAESAMLAGLPIAPTTYSPYGPNPYMSKIRQQQVLENMVALGMITENAKLDALSSGLVFTPQGTSISAPHFVMYVKDLLVKTYGEEVVARGGLSVTTTLDLTYQDILQSEIRSELDKLAHLNVQNGAGLVLAPQTGEILAMVGSRDFFDTQKDGQVNVTLQPRQPGSAIKPITYALAFSRGLSPSTIIEDGPICFKIPGQSDYCPRNYDGRFHGSVTLRTALGSSYNIPAIKLLNTYGLDNMITLAKKLGITTWDDSSRYGLSLTLGGGEITMLDLASVYSVFARGGTKLPPQSILSVRGPTGSELERADPQEVEVLSPAVSYQINSILSDPLARAPAFGLNSILRQGGDKIAVKTGTTNNLRDNWTIGYSPEILVATWVGNNDNSPMSSVASGITGASPIWARTITRLSEHLTLSDFAMPNNLVLVNLSCTATPHYEYFVKGDAPTLNCLLPQGKIGDSGATTSP